MEYNYTCSTLTVPNLSCPTPHLFFFFLYKNYLCIRIWILLSEKNVLPNLLSKQQIWKLQQNRSKIGYIPVHYCSRYFKVLRAELSFPTEHPELASQLLPHMYIQTIWQQHSNLSHLSPDSIWPSKTHKLVLWSYLLCIQQMGHCCPISKLVWNEFLRKWKGQASQD